MLIKDLKLKQPVKWACTDEGGNEAIEKIVEQVPNVVMGPSLQPWGGEGAVFPGKAAIFKGKTRKKKEVTIYNRQGVRGKRTGRSTTRIRVDGWRVAPGKKLHIAGRAGNFGRARGVAGEYSNDVYVVRGEKKYCGRSGSQIGGGDN